MHIVLLSGGSGKRLWPLSNAGNAKQFLKLLHDSEGKQISMVQRVVSQIRSVDADIDITIATCKGQAESVISQVDGSYSLVVEPERRDTAPAIMLACEHLWSVQNANEDDTVIVMPIDSYVDQAYYGELCRLDEVVQSDCSDLVLLGVKPSCPSQKYGYIVPDGAIGDSRNVLEFVEKPSELTARELIKRGALWNCGVFAFKLRYLRSITRKYLKSNTFEDFRSRYGELPRNSFDYEVVEHAGSLGVVTYNGAWKDLGTWNTITEEMAEAASGMVLLDGSTCEGVHVINELEIPILVTGLRDSVVVATTNGILVSGKEQSPNIKAMVGELEGRFGQIELSERDDS